ncbi:hypothetical protein PAXRUDRAFT_566951 [Paxillus rubicundulus Ve08.2h10]|uniref:Uncharacterized protein n=1 Tax=Paxillus rubicundulus Ve08.2h10 TaxID=930991 RepID=A0A0D0DZJ5_9AGAM|nr:hypothetical protein PAXRUDRAFT_566951 [Paxillus rubicundulus Ve08.2h10]
MLCSARRMPVEAAQSFISCLTSFSRALPMLLIRVLTDPRVHWAAGAHTKRTYVCTSRSPFYDLFIAQLSRAATMLIYVFYSRLHPEYDLHSLEDCR